MPGVESFAFLAWAEDKSLRRHARFQLFEPVDQDADLCDGPIFFAGIQHHEVLAVWRNVVHDPIGPSRPRERRGEQHLGPARAEPRGRADLHGEDLVAVSKEQLPAIARPDRLQSSGR